MIAKLTYWAKLDSAGFRQAKPFLIQRQGLIDLYFLKNISA